MFIDTQWGNFKLLRGTTPSSTWILMGMYDTQSDINIDSKKLSFNEMVNKVHSIASLFLEKGYVPGNLCDEFAVSVLTSSFSQASATATKTTREKVINFLAGKPEDFMVSQHIASVKSKGTSIPNPTKAGFYLMLMDGKKGDNDYDPHAALLIIDSSGNYNLYHSSSSNKVPNDGYEVHDDITQLENSFAYSNFYYIRIDQEDLK